MKKISLLLVVVMLFTMFISCSTSKLTTSVANDTTDQANGTNTEKVEMNVYGLKGPTGMGMAKLMSDNDAGETANDYNFALVGSPDEITASIIKGDFDVAAVPSNLASVLYNKTKGEVQVAAVNTLGILYLLENGNTINSIEDLRGKTVYSTGESATPEYAFNYILEENGINPEKDVTITYLSEHSELATKMTSGDVVLGVVPEPFVSSVLANNSDVHIALNLTEEWNKVAGDDSELIMGCIVVNKKFADSNPDALNAFLAEYESSINYANENIDEAAALVENYGILASAAIAKNAIPNCNMTYIGGAEMKTALSGFLTVLYEANPASVGGTMPGDDFYYEG